MAGSGEDFVWDDEIVRACAIWKDDARVARWFGITEARVARVRADMPLFDRTRQGVRGGEAIESDDGVAQQARTGTRDLLRRIARVHPERVTI